MKKINKVKTCMQVMNTIISKRTKSYVFLILKIVFCLI